MNMLLIDPTLRRARLVRATVAAIALVSVGTLAIFARGLTGATRPAPSLPSPRRPAARVPNRPLPGRRPAYGRKGPVARERPRVPIARATPRLPVIAFVDPAARGAL